jgi:hypothetical protein
VAASDHEIPWSDVAQAFAPVAAALDQAVALVRAELGRLRTEVEDRSWRGVCDREVWSSYSYWARLSVTERESTGDGLVERASVLVTYAEQLLRSVPPEPIRLEWHAERFYVDSSSWLFKECGEQSWDPGHRPPAEEVATAMLGLLSSALERLRRS